MLRRALSCKNTRPVMGAWPQSQKTLGLTFPADVLSIADEVIE
jgi:hypothetical protein